jgi:hypothetical protein
MRRWPPPPLYVVADPDRLPPWEAGWAIALAFVLLALLGVVAWL